jgi:phage gp46-like protein
MADLLPTNNLRILGTDLWTLSRNRALSQIARIAQTLTAVI